MAQTLERLNSRIKKLEEEVTGGESMLDPEDRLHFLEGTKAERDQKQAEIMKYLEDKYPGYEGQAMFVHYVGAKDGKPLDPADG